MVCILEREGQEGEEGNEKKEKKPAKLAKIRLPWLISELVTKGRK